MANLVTVEANNLLGASLGQAAYSAPSGYVKVALVTTTTASSASAAGSEVSGGSDARQAVTFAAPSGGSISSNGAVTFTNMPAATVHQIEIWDSAGTPIRRWFGSLTADKTTGAGDKIGRASCRERG